MEVISVDCVNDYDLNCVQLGNTQVISNTYAICTSFHKLAVQYLLIGK